MKRWRYIIIACLGIKSQQGAFSRYINVMGSTIEKNSSALVSKWKKSHDSQHKKKKNFHFLFFSSSWKNVILLFFFTLCTWRQQTHPVFRILTPCFVWNSLKSIESSEYQGKVNKMKAWASSHSIFKLSFRCFREINQAKKVDRQEVSVVCWSRAFSAGQFTQCTTRTSRTILDHSLSWRRAQIAGHFFFIMKVRSLESKRNRAGKRGVREWIFLSFFSLSKIYRV